MALAKDQITLINVNDGYVGNDGKTYVLNILGGQRSITYNEVGASPSPSPSAFSFELLVDGVSVTPTSRSWSATGHLSGTSTAATFTPTYATNFNSSYSNAVNLTVVYGGISVKAVAPIAITKIGEIRYTWIKYADNASGEGLSDSPTGKKYIGIAVNKTTATESTTPGDYTWSLFEGPQGPQGPQGVQGPEGAPALSVLLLNENQPIPVTTGRLVSPAQTITIPFTAFLGSNRIACTATLGSLPSGVTVSSNTAGTSSANGTIVLNVAANANLGGATSAFDTGTIVITINANNVNTPLSFSFAKIIPGTDGTARMYFVEPAINYLIRNADNSYSMSSISAFSYYRDGTSTTRTARTAYWKAEYLVGSTWTSFATHTSSLISTYTPNVTSVPSTATAIKITATSDVGLSTVYDFQTIPIVVDSNTASDMVENAKIESYLRGIESFSQLLSTDKNNIEEKVSFLLGLNLDIDFMNNLNSVNDLYTGIYDTFVDDVTAKLLTGTITQIEFEAFQDQYVAILDSYHLVLNLVEEGYRLYQNSLTSTLIESIQIGTRNLLLNSDFSRGLNQWTVETGSFTQVKDIQNVTFLRGTHTPTGDIKPRIVQIIPEKAVGYSIGLDAYSNVANSIIRVNIESKNGTYTIVKTQEFPLTENIRRFSFKVGDLDTTLNYYLTIQVISGTATFTKPKVETGIISTDWTPAPGDYLIRIEEILDDNILTRSERATLNNQFQEITTEYNTIQSNFSGNVDLAPNLDVLESRYNTLYSVLDPVLGLVVDGNGIPTNPNYSNEDIVSIVNSDIISALNAYYQALNNFKTGLFKESYEKSTQSWSELTNKIDNTREAVMQHLLSNGDPTKNFIYEENGEIYINAAYIRAGQLAANYIKTGILSSEPPAPGQAPESWLNLNDGTFSFGGGSLTYTPSDGLKISFGNMLDGYLNSKADNEVVEDVGAVAEQAKALAESIQNALDANIQFSNGKIIIGTVGAGMFRFELSNISAIFYNGTTRIAEFTNDSLKVKNIILENSITIGLVSNSKFKIEVKASNGNLSFRRV